MAIDRVGSILLEKMLHKKGFHTKQAFAKGKKCVIPTPDYCCYH